MKRLPVVVLFLVLAVTGITATAPLAFGCNPQKPIGCRVLVDNSTQSFVERLRDRLTALLASIF